MKEFSHPSQTDMAPADLNRAISATLTVARNEYKYLADVDVSLGELPFVTCHINEINQAVLNILINAAHAISDANIGTERRGKIGVRTYVEGRNAVIAINDNGPGIPEHVRPRIFEPFFTTKEVGRGTGQGLAIAWAAIKEKHAGELSFETQEGEGTCFYVRLPIAGKAALRTSLSEVRRESG
jgi:signal transduction histidine kinase